MLNQIKIPRTNTIMIPRVIRHSTKLDLRSLGIEIVSEANSVLAIIEFRYDEIERIQEAVIEEGLTMEEKFALQLAETQECRNDYLHDSEIYLVNRSFGLKIDQALIQAIGQQFI